MGENERIKAERKEYFKTASFSKKLEFIWDYYKIHILIALALLTGIGYYVHHLVTAKDMVLSGMLLNVDALEHRNDIDKLKQEILEHLKVDTQKYDVDFIDSYTLTGDVASDYETQQAVIVQLGAGSLDFTISPLEYMQNYTYQNCFYDFRDLLSEEQFKKYEPYFLYIDGEYMKEYGQRSLESSEENPIVLPDFTRPEDMEDPIPVLIDLSQCKTITDLYTADKESLVFGIMGSVKSEDNVLLFLDYIME